MEFRQLRVEMSTYLHHRLVARLQHGSVNYYISYPVPRIRGFVAASTCECARFFPNVISGRPDMIIGVDVVPERCVLESGTRTENVPGCRSVPIRVCMFNSIEVGRQSFASMPPIPFHTTGQELPAVMVRDNSYWKAGEVAAVYCKQAPGMDTNVMQPWRVIQSFHHGKSEDATV